MVEMVFTKVLLTIIVFFYREVKTNEDVMERMSVQLGVAINFCERRNGAPTELIKQMMHYWDGDFAPTPRLGCLLECAFIRLEIFDKQGNLSIPNGIAFLKANGADDATVKKLAEAMRNQCPRAGTGCASALAYAQCFRGFVMLLQMQPPSLSTHTPTAVSVHTTHRPQRQRDTLALNG